jgi:hypothetical protein
MSFFKHTSITPLLAIVLLASATASGAASGSAVAAQGEPYFRVLCSFNSGADTLCEAELRLCSKSSAPDCRDQGQVNCPQTPSALAFVGFLQRATSGNKIALTGVASASDELVPTVTMGPAKTMPKPGKPVLSDSTLEFGDLMLQGECAVSLAR